MSGTYRSGLADKQNQTIAGRPMRLHGRQRIGAEHAAGLEPAHVAGRVSLDLASLCPTHREAG